MRVTTWAMLERHFGGLTADEVDAELSAVPPAGASPSSAAAVEYLRQFGGPDLDRGAGPGVHQRRTIVAARTLADSLRSTMTIDQAADLLGVSRSRVSHRIADGSLWATGIHGRRLVPRWQFTADGQVIPGLPKVVSAIPTSLHPLAVEAFMTTPRVDFDDQSPVEWLTSGGDPGVIAEWFISMGHG